MAIKKSFKADLKQAKTKSRTADTTSITRGFIPCLRSSQCTQTEEYIPAEGTPRLAKLLPLVFGKSVHSSMATKPDVGERQDMAVDCTVREGFRGSKAHDKLRSSANTLRHAVANKVGM